MKRLIGVMAVLGTVLLLCFASSAPAQESGQLKPHAKVVSEAAHAMMTVTPPTEGAKPVISSHPPGTLVIPKSSMPQQATAGQIAPAHTNIVVYLPTGLSPDEAPPFGGYNFETPASIACHYNLVSTSAAPGCDPYVTTVNPTGGSATIAIVDAYDDPVAQSDLAWFSLQFGLPLSLSQFQVIWANATGSGASCKVVGPDLTGGWELEESLDVEWAHAMAPNAQLYLVEACSNSGADLLLAVSVATNLVECGQTEINPTTGVLGTCPTPITGAGEVSMSWGSGEFSGESTYDTYFNQPYPVEYFASAGDSPGVSWPCVSDYVICAGGTTIRRSNGTSLGVPVFNFEQETAWVFGGGGISADEPQPPYQNGTGGSTAVTNCTSVSTTRCVPDVSFDADPYTGVYVYDTFGVDFISGGSWYAVGGTSVSSPSLAGIFDKAQTTSGFSNSLGELEYIYALRGNASDYTHITAGFCGFFMGTTAPAGYSLCNGIGVVNTYGGE